MLFVSCYDMLVYVSYRYNFSRITWREAQIRLVGSPFRYAGKKVLYRFLNILSLGLLIHRFDVAMYDYLIHQAQYGGVPFSFQKTPIGSLRRTNIITLLLVPSTFGLSRLWYWAALRRYKFNHTTIGNLRLKATDTGPGLLMLLISTIFLLLVIGIVLTMIVAFNNGLLLLIAGIALLLVAIPFAQSSIIQLFVVYRASHTFVLGDLETFQKIQEEAALRASIVPEKASDFESDYGLIQLF